MSSQSKLIVAKLRRKNRRLGLFLSLGTLGVLGLLYLISAAFVTQSLGRLETVTVRQDVRRAIDGVDRELRGLLVSTCDYARWDEFYAYMTTSDRTFERENFASSSHFTNLLNVDVLAAVLPDGQMRYGQQLSQQGIAPTPLPTSVKTYLQNWAQQQSIAQTQDTQTGWLASESGPMLLTICSVTNSAETAPPQGGFAMGRVLSRSQIQRLEQQLQVQMKLVDLNGSLSPSEAEIRDRLIRQPKIGDSALPDDAIAVVPITGDRIAGYARIDDINGTPLALLRVELNRDLHQQGWLASQLLGGVLLAAGVGFGLLGRWLLKQLMQESQRLARAEQALAHESVLRLANARYQEKAVELEITLKELNKEKERSEQLLINILPESIVQRLKENDTSIAEHFDEVTILFADIVNFTPIAARLQPFEVVELLNGIFSEFDDLVEEFGLEKIKTIGDAYMVAAGLPVPRTDHAEAIANMALAMQQRVADFRSKTGEAFQIRVGINTGTVVAGVIGTKKFIYDLWGDTVNVASRMESTGLAGGIQVTAATYNWLKDRYDFEVRGTVQVKGKGAMETYWLRGKQSTEEG
ncbi:MULTISPECIES: adenylate/guanylate cyclase domain-containing protein [Cyanophyceae]|uniref:guanylate cyclase n=1 Tax=Leptolyngbya subtilissima DQ-A4 TaxID=2933933 RepID=A0ABV0K505_9CYAN|nr:adenylate/guanylate cyclase domain-containing protein [Nodosilinea sp. FACHB-141]MBD2112810.1 histidine kinase [Nodosilinea sp. FACHB-141]